MAPDVVWWRQGGPLSPPGQPGGDTVRLWPKTSAASGTWFGWMRAGEPRRRRPPRAGCCDAICAPRTGKGPIARLADMDAARGAPSTSIGSATWRRTSRAWRSTCGTWGTSTRPWPLFLEEGGLAYPDMLGGRLRRTAGAHRDRLAVVVALAGSGRGGGVAGRRRGRHRSSSHFEVQWGQDATGGHRAHGVRGGGDRRVREASHSRASSGPPSARRPPG